MHESPSPSLSIQNKQPTKHQSDNFCFSIMSWPVVMLCPFASLICKSGKVESEALAETQVMTPATDFLSGDKEKTDVRPVSTWWVGRSQASSTVPTCIAEGASGQSGAGATG